MELFHVKPHGSLYGMAAKSADVAKAVADAAKVFKVPILGMAGTLHEKVYTAEGLQFISEYYADLDYGDDGSLIITREHHAVDARRAAARALRAVKDGIAESVNGREVRIRADCICVHSDTPNAVEVAQAVKTAVADYLGQPAL
jgi:5-oxoprolinase (ATP-hydrolysing) subunit A